MMSVGDDLFGDREAHSKQERVKIGGQNKNNKKNIAKGGQHGKASQNNAFVFFIPAFSSSPPFG